MIDTKNKKCKEENCEKYPSFNYSDKKFGVYCSKHKLENMIDVKHKRCQEKNCNKIPTFNYISKIPKYCSEHKLENIIDLVSKRCQKENCNKYPLYNFENKFTAIFCNEHKLKNMIDVKRKICIQEHCDSSCNKKYKGYCLRCFMYNFPDEKISHNYKLKENHVRDFLNDNFNKQLIIFDKVVGGCSKRRPDAYIDLFTHIIIIECDENQHQDYSCENKRTMELFQDFNNRPMIFIRFNPDSYILNGKKIKSCFQINNSGIQIIKDFKEWNNRLNKLKEIVEYNIKNIPEKELTNEFLFCDN